VTQRGRISCAVPFLTVLCAFLLSPHYQYPAVRQIAKAPLTTVLSSAFTDKNAGKKRTHENENDGAGLGVKKQHAGESAHRLT
jgi:hypothetical protein